MEAKNHQELEPTMADTATLSIIADDGRPLSAYRSTPVGLSRGSVVVLQELFGVNEHIRRVCDDFAKDGYVAIAPALFDRVAAGMELGYSAEDVQTGLAARDALPLERVLGDVQAAIDSVAGDAPVFVLGYCWGGTLAFLAAARLSGLAGAVGYYGSMIPDYCDDAPRVPLMLHFGRHDHTLPPERVALIQEARPEAEIFVYDTGHGFNCDARPSFDPAAAELARRRTLSFFYAHADLG